MVADGKGVKLGNSVMVGPRVGVWDGATVGLARTPGLGAANTAIKPAQ